MAVQTFKKLPGVVAITRGIVIGDAVMFSELSDGGEKPLSVIRHGIRGTQNVAMDSKEGAAATTKRREVSNVQTTDSAKTDPDAVALVVRFGLRFVPLGGMPVYSAAGEKETPESVKAFRDSVFAFLEKAKTSDAVYEIACRYARNIANGRWLWRNRMVATSVTIKVKNLVDSKEFSFDALKTPLHAFENYSKDEKAVAQILADGLTGKSTSALEIEARVATGFNGSFEAYPSQNYLEDKPRGFARSLYCLGVPDKNDALAVRSMGQAAIRDQKIANALRTFDTWYPTFPEVERPIPIEPNGANLEAQDFFRPANSPSSAFKLMCRLNELDPASNDGMFMVACLIRGGVFSGGKGQ